MKIKPESNSHVHKSNVTLEKILLLLLLQWLFGNFIFHLRQ